MEDGDRRGKIMNPWALSLNFEPLLCGDSLNVWILVSYPRGATLNLEPVPGCRRSFGSDKNPHGVMRVRSALS